MELKNFKIRDTIVQKNDNNIKWTVIKIDQNNNSIYLQRKGGYFNEMITQFNGDNENFEAASRTEQRIKRENRILERQKSQEDFQQSKKNSSNIILTKNLN